MSKSKRNTRRNRRAPARRRIAQQYPAKTEQRVADMIPSPSTISAAPTPASHPYSGFSEIPLKTKFSILCKLYLKSVGSYLSFLGNSLLSGFLDNSPLSAPLYLTRYPQPHQIRDEKIRLIRLRLEYYGIHLSYEEAGELLSYVNYQEMTKSQRMLEYYQSVDGQNGNALTPVNSAVLSESSLRAAALPTDPSNGDHLAQLKLGEILEERGDPEAEYWFYWAAVGGGYHRSVSPYEY
jgi:hypothetical protein